MKVACGLRMTARARDGAAGRPAADGGSDASTEALVACLEAAAEKLVDGAPS